MAVANDRGGLVVQNWEVSDAARVAIIAHTYPGQAGVAEVARQVAAGERPRRDYMEVARFLAADVVDSEFLMSRAAALSRIVARRAGLPAGQVCEAFLLGKRYQTICVWADRIGLPLALLHKLTHVRRDLTLVTAWPSRPEKALFLRYLKVHSNLRAIISGSSVQLQLAASLGVPRHKLWHVPWPVDERFWMPQGEAVQNMVCSVGWEARDFGTLLKATSGLDLHVQLAVGITALANPKVNGNGPTSGEQDSGGDDSSFSSLDPVKHTYSYASYRQWLKELGTDELGDNVTVRVQLAPLALRQLYAQARFVVVPLQDVDSDCGVTTITEAMAMGKAVIVTRTRGQVDVVMDGEHGIYVPPADPDALRSAIKHLLRNPDEAERMGRAGRARVEELYTMDMYVRRVAAILVGRDADGDLAPTIV